MPVKLYYALGVLVVTNVGNLYLMRKLKTSNRQILEMNNHLADLVIESESRVTYLAAMLDEHEIELSEFDLIALNAAIT